jgi:hypothetical protein
MPQLGFKKHFPQKVLSGEKPLTLRALREDGRDPKIGQTLYMYTGLRTKQCQKFAEKTCRFAINIKLSFNFIEIPGFRNLTNPDQLALFSRLDGFDSYEQFLKFHEIIGGTSKPMRLIAWITRDELKQALAL